MHAERRDGHAPTLLALHGFAGTGRDWTPPLAPFGNRRILPDLPGHGGSGAPLGSFPEVASALSALLSKGESAVWLGYSFGARCLWEVALAHPSSVRALVLVGAHPGIADAGALAARRAQDEADARLLEAEGLAPFLESWHTRDAFATRRGRPDWKDEVDRKLRTNRAPHLAASLRRFGLGTQPDYGPRLKEIRAPTLWVTGERDPAYGILAKEACRRMPSAEHAVVPGVGHGAHLEDPEAFQDILRRFLDRLVGRGGSASR